jgi:hypothetical protein
MGIRTRLLLGAAAMSVLTGACTDRGKEGMRDDAERTGEAVGREVGEAARAVGGAVDRAGEEVRRAGKAVEGAARDAKDSAEGAVEGLERGIGGADNAGQPDIGNRPGVINDGEGPFEQPGPGESVVRDGQGPLEEE